MVSDLICRNYCSVARGSFSCGQMSSGQNLYPTDKLGLRRIVTIEDLEDLRFHNGEDSLWASGYYLCSVTAGYQCLRGALLPPSSCRQTPSWESSHNIGPSINFSFQDPVLLCRHPCCTSCSLQLHWPTEVPSVYLNTGSDWLLQTSTALSLPTFSYNRPLSQLGRLPP
jgi:hypothetical protein